MAEPKSKKIKIDSKVDINNTLKILPKTELFPIKSLEEIHSHLLSKCLCGVELSVIKDVLLQCNRSLSRVSTSVANQDLLLYTGMLSFFFEVSVKQYSDGYQCPIIAELVSAGADIEGGVVDNLFMLLASEDKFISYSSSRAMTSLLLILKDSESKAILQKLAGNLIKSKNLLEISHSLNIMQKIIDWKDTDGHVLEQIDETLPETCKRIQIPEAKTNSPNNTKVSATKSLESLWPQLLHSLISLISDYTPEKEHVVVSFFSLWESILSVKANLSIINIKLFYFGLDKLLRHLTSTTSVIIWKMVIDLYNEFLCYGSTLALQDASDASCDIAQSIIAAIKYKHFLEEMPNDENLDSNETGNIPTNLMGGECSSSNSLMNVMPELAHSKVLLHKLILLTLKAVALIVKESICDSSSDDSSHSGSSETELFTAPLIDKNICETLKKLDKFVKSRIPFHPEASIAEWIIHLFSDQDDWLIEAMLCCLDIYKGLWQTTRESSEFGRRLNPHESFGMFANAVHFDHDVFLDFLVSNETCFLLYLLRYLKFLKRNWFSFLDQDERTRCNVMSVLIRLRLAIERLVSKNLFPYDITPILRLLDQCEELYEDSG